MTTYGEALAQEIETLKGLPVKIGDDIPNPSITYGDLFGNESLIFALSQDNVRPVFAQGLRNELGEEEYNKKIAEFQKEKEQKYKMYLTPPSSLTEEEIFPEYTSRRKTYDQNQDRRSRMTRYERGNLPESFLTPEAPMKPIGYDRALKLRDFGYDPRKELDIEGITEFRLMGNAFGFYNETPDDLNYRKNYLGTDITNRQENPDVRGKFAERLPGYFQYAIPGDPNSGIAYVENGKRVLLDSPLFTALDAVEFGVQEGPLIAADMFLGLKGFGKFQDEFLKKIPEGKKGLRKFADNMAFNVMLSGGTATTRFGQLLLGNSFGVHNRDITAMAKEAGLIGLIALGGNTAISAFMDGIPAVYRTITGRDLAAKQVKALEDAFKQANASRTAGARRIRTESGDFEEVTLKDIDETILNLSEEIGENIGKFKPNLSQATKDTYIADLEAEVLKLATDPKYAQVYDEMMRGNKKLTQDLFKAIFKDLNNETTGDTVAKQITRVFEGQSKEFEDEGVSIIARLSSDLDTIKGLAKGKNVLDQVTDPSASSRLVERFTKRINLIARNSKDKLTKSVSEVFSDPQLKNIQLTGKGFRKEFDQLEQLTLPSGKLNIGQTDMNKQFNKLFPEAIYNRLKSTRDKTFSLEELNQIRVDLNSFASTNLNPGTDIADQKLFEGIRNLQESIEDTIFNQIQRSLPKKQADKYIELINAQKFGIELANQQTLKNLLQTQPEGVSGFLLSTQPKGAAGNTQAKNFMDFLKATNSYDEIDLIRNDVAEYISRNYLDTDMADPLTLAKGYQKFLKEKLPTLEILFPEELFGKLSATKKGFNKNVIKRLENLDKEKSVLASQFGDSNPFNIVTRILATGEADKAGGTIISRLDSLERLLKGADPDVKKIIEKDISDATKKYILQRASKDGIFDVNLLNNFMNQGFAPAELVGQNLSFEGVLGRLIQNEKDFFNNLNVLRDVGMRVQQNIGSKSVLRKQMSQELFDPGTEYLRRFFIPPLTQFGRRTTALETIITDRNVRFMGDVLTDERLFKAYIDAIRDTKKLSVLVKILNTERYAHYQDIGSTAKFYDTDEKEQRPSKKQTLTSEMRDEFINLQNRIGAFN